MKYDRIDPAEVQALNNEIARLKAEVISVEEKQKEEATLVCVHVSPYPAPILKSTF